MEVQSNDQQYYDDQLLAQQQQGYQYPKLQDPYKGATFINQDSGFLQWLLNFRKEMTIPLKNSWRGMEFDSVTQSWVAGKSSKRMMNEDGITWCISFIESYINPVFVVSNLDDKSYNFTMREACHNIWNGLCDQYEEFEIDKINISRVAEEIESKIRALCLAVKDGQLIDFFSTQHQTYETKNINADMTQQKKGVFSSMASMFRKDQQQQSGRY